MPLEGFDKRWKTFPDFIIGITKDIWEDRNIHHLRRLYADAIVVRSPASVVVGNEGVIAATMATLAEWPDRELPGEDVIWSGSDKDGTLLSSHRLICTATHTRPGMYGEPTGKTLRYRILADCACRDNQVYDEWLVRDQGAIVRQMGIEPKAFAADLIEREGGPESCVQPLTPATDRKGAYSGRGNDNPVGERHGALLSAIMNAEMSAIPREYDRAAELHYPGGHTDLGHKGADRFWMGLRAAFPNANFSIDHQIGMQERGRADRSAVRWSLHGRHEGWGMFGTPTGAEVYILGISHAEFGPRGLHREYTLIDETAIWKQIVMKTG